MKKKFNYKSIITTIFFCISINIVHANIQIIERSIWEADESYQDEIKHINNNKKTTTTTDQEIQDQVNEAMKNIDILKTKSLKDIMKERKGGLLKGVSSDALYEIMLKIFPNLDDYEKIIYNADGMKLWWPRVYSKNIQKIIIHHTAENTEKDINGDGIIDEKDRTLSFDLDKNGITDINDYKAMVRRIYKYHAISNDWGDVGYNYLIDPLGNIYEGRAGGQKVIGGHVYYGNVDTVGIAVIGNYEYQKISDNAKASLINLIADISVKQNIDLEQKSSYRNTYTYNVIGHRDLGFTACPGKYIYSLLDNIRIDANKKNKELLAQKAKEDKYQNNTQKDIAYKEMAQKKIKAFKEIKKDLIYLIEQNRPKVISFEVLNTSGITWEADTYINFDQSKNIKIKDPKVYIQSTTNNNKHAKFVIRFTPIVEKDVVLEGTLHINDQFVSDQTIKIITQKDMENVSVDILSYNIQDINNDKSMISVVIKNTSIVNIGKKTVNKMYIAPADEDTKCFYEPRSWLLKNKIILTKEDFIEKNNTGSFVFYINKNCKHEELNLKIKSFYSDNVLNNTNLKININDTKDNTIFTGTGVGMKNINYGNIRVKLDFYAHQTELSFNTSYDIYDEAGKKIIEKIRSLSIQKDKEFLIGDAFGKKISTKILRFVPINAYGIVTIKNMEKVSSVNSDIKYNKFRNIIELRIEDDKIIAINELFIDDYMKGLAETISSDPYEKRKAIAMAAKNYALYYISGAKKFIDKPYDLDSDPQVSQYYIGYGFEELNKDWVKIINETSKHVILYNNKLIKTPYFSSDDGKTKSAYEVWGWADTTYLVSKEDPYCKGNVSNGHGVGMSGCGAKGMANDGKKYDEILKYYYEGVNIVKL